MSELKAAKCEQCDRVESCRPNTSHPDNWFLLFGPNGRMDFCSVACLALHFRPHITNELGSGSNQ